MTTTITIVEPISSVRVTDEAVHVEVLEQRTVLTVEPAGSRDALFLHGYPIASGAPGTGTALVFDGTYWVPTVLEGTVLRAEDEVPSGALDGVNPTFSTAFLYAAGSLRVYLNGLRQQTGGDFTESGGASFTFTVPPTVGDSIRVDYSRA